MQMVGVTVPDGLDEQGGIDAVRSACVSELGQRGFGHVGDVHLADSGGHVDDRFRQHSWDRRGAYVVYVLDQPRSEAVDQCHSLGCKVRRPLRVPRHDDRMPGRGRLGGQLPSDPDAHVHLAADGGSELLPSAELGRRLPAELGAALLGCLRPDPPGTPRKAGTV
jgi:hypothetical protein